MTDKTHIDSIDRGHGSHNAAEEDGENREAQIVRYFFTSADQLLHIAYLVLGAEKQRGGVTV